MAKLNVVDPRGWRADALGRIPAYKITRVDDLLPLRWSGQRSGWTLTLIEIGVNVHRIHCGFMVALSYSLRPQMMKYR